MSNLEDGWHYCPNWDGHMGVIDERCAHCGSKYHCHNCGGAGNMYMTGHIKPDIWPTEWFCPKREVRDIPNQTEVI